MNSDPSRPRRYLAGRLFIGGVLLAVCIAVTLWLSGRLTAEAIASPSYFKAINGIGPSPDVLAFERDWRRNASFRRRFQHLSTMQDLFPELHSGKHYPGGSYRAGLQQSVLEWEAETGKENTAEFWWFEGFADDWGGAIRVDEKGNILGFSVAKG